MPTYVYHCTTCSSDFEAYQKFSDDPLRSCPQGHESVRRVFTPAGIIFKGSGWYIKDSKGDSNVPAPSGDSAKSSKGDAAASPAKSESESSPKSGSESSSKSEVKSEAA